MADSGDITLACAQLWKVFGEGDLAGGLGASGAEAAALADSLRAEGHIVGCCDIDIEIKRGEFFVLMGLSGSGKSTLLRCLSRLTEPTAGRLTLDGEDFLNAGPKALMDIRRRKMGMVFQHFGLFPHMTVLDNVAFPLKVQGVGNGERENRARQMVSLVGLEGREAAYPHQLSGGQKQRVGIARSLAVDPEIWFLDEPFSALDPLIRWQMQSELLRLQNLFHKTVVFVTHDFIEAVRLADRIAIMKDGRVVQIGTPEDIVLNPADAYVSEFVKEAPRTKIIKVSQLMEPVEGDDAAEQGLDPGMTLEDALTWSAERGGTLSVTDTAGRTIGRIVPERLSAALSGARLD
ncbi:MAG: betaine/proline/choline family ABC transporter ATP-binding protein [Rhodospirillales bacterium]|nr:betaine/proline/choline family ABC transporter ATP-binding protein [Rhodospirillales bacterium]